MSEVYVVNETTVTPAEGRVLVEWLPVTKKAGTIELPENTPEWTRIGRVVKVGEGVTRYKKDNIVLMNHLVGETIHSYELYLANKNIKVVGEDQIIAKLEE